MTEYESFLKEIGFWEVERFPWDKPGYDMRTQLEKEMGLIRHRDIGIKRFGFAILTEDAIEILRLYAPILEVGAGTGYWAHEFIERGVDYVATDPEPCCKSYFKGSEQWVGIEPLSALDAVRKYPERALMFCWPTYADGWAAEALQAYTGSTVIYVGESDGGCTADDNFHHELNSHWDEEQVINIPQWRGIHDRIFIYRRH